MNKFRVLQKCLFGSGLLTMVIIIFSASVIAQSGRRVKTPIPAPTPVPEAAPAPQPTPEPEPVKAQYTFTIFRQISFNIYNQLLTPENMQRWAVERLQGSPLLEIEMGGELNRKEAINRAKTTEEIYVILLSLSEEEFMNSGRDQRTGQFKINYEVFSPKTGKTLHSGTSYPGLRKTTGVLGQARRNICHPNVYGDNLLLLESSYEVAERIMSNFNIPVPPVKCR